MAAIGPTRTKPSLHLKSAVRCRSDLDARSDVYASEPEHISTSYVERPGSRKGSNEEALPALQRKAAPGVGAACQFNDEAPGLGVRWVGGSRALL